MYFPLLGWGLGDPHITTLDGLQYTFNGLGEYTLVETTDGAFTLQGRTVRAKDENGDETPATVYAAFVAKDETSDAAQVEMTEDGNGLSLLYFICIYSPIIAI